MTVAAALALLISLQLAAALWMLAPIHARDRMHLRRRVLVNLTSGRTFAGVLWSKTGDWLVLRNAEMMDRGREPVPVDGEVVVERGTVDFVQVL